MSDRPPTPTPPAELALGPRPAPPPDGALAALFEAVAAETVDRPPTPLSRLRELRTATRVTLALAAAVAFGVAWWLAAGAVMAPVSELPTAGLVAAGLGLALLFGAVATALRGLARPSRAALAWIVVILGFAAPPLVALATAAPAARDAVFTACVAMGLSLGAAVTGLVWALDRGGLTASRRLTAAAVAGGVTAWATLELACTGYGLSHAVIDHALVAVPLAAVGLGALALHRRRA